MIREVYVTEDGSKINYQKAYLKKVRNGLIILAAIILLILIYILYGKSTNAKFCTSMREKIWESALRYAEEREILPTIEGDYIKLTLDDLVKEKYIKKEDITVKESTAKSDLVITKYKDDYIVTMDLENIEHCSTKNRSWGKESEKYNADKEIVKVTAYYNYRERETNYTKWSNEYNEDELKKKEDKKYKIRLPKDDRNLADIPEEAELEDIEMNKHIYYQYQDKSWKFYDIAGDYTNYFSSERPEGYSNYDSNTLRYTEWTEYSLTYPDEKDYRTIETRNAYKWYYMDGKNKVYYNNGTFTVEPDDPKYDQRDKEKVSMYRYRDREYRWYNGTRRRYSAYYNNVPKGYTYRDDELYKLGSWSSLRDTPQVNDSNRFYRTEKEVYKYSFRKKYNIYSLYVLNKELPKHEFEKQTEMSLQNLFEDEELDVKVTYKFNYK